MDTRYLKTENSGQPNISLVNSLPVATLDVIRIRVLGQTTIKSIEWRTQYMNTETSGQPKISLVNSLPVATQYYIVINTSEDKQLLDQSNGGRNIC